MRIGSCEGNRLSRRTLLTVGTVGGLGLTLENYFAMKQAKADTKHYDFIEAKAQSVIHIFLPGGMAHQESFDPKPYSPLEYLSLIHISEPTRLLSISYAVFCLKKK